MKILILGDSKSVFVCTFIEKLQKYDFDVQIFDPYRFFLYDSNLKIVKKFNIPSKLLDKIPRRIILLSLQVRQETILLSIMDSITKKRPGFCVLDANHWTSLMN